VRPASAAALITPRARRRTVRGRFVTLARLECRTGTCSVSAPKRVAIRLGGRRHRLKVIAPRRIDAGERATVRLRLRKRTLAALSGRSARVRVPVRVRAADQTISRTLRATLRRPR
jgi:hypothetical protein